MDYSNILIRATNWVGDAVMCLPALQAMKKQYGDRIYGRYGFTDAFNPNNGWVAPNVIGIDVGITMLMAENARTGLVWETFMKNPEAKRGMAQAGFQNYKPAAPGT